MRILLAIFLFLVSCAPLQPVAPPQTQTPPSQQTPSSQQTKDVKKITGIAAWDNVLSPWLGTPYLSGGSTKSGADCSGFVGSVYMEKEKMYLPRTSAEQFKLGTSINKGRLKVGDLVFFKDRGRINHVGIFTGNGTFIHASSSRGVMISPLDEGYWKPRYAGARRYL